MALDYAQEVSSKFDPNWRRDGVFCDIPHYSNISVKITFISMAGEMALTCIYIAQISWNFDTI